ncbi:MAG: hypothetical protein QFX34_05170 [Candidatus Verstraetearchaeota archaeon]|nr:hypothetical protein [Candidatus Verstraetearchaeota archaeon]
MGKSMRGYSSGIVLMGLVVSAATLAASWASLTFMPLFFPRDLHVPVPWDLELFYMMKAVVSTVNLVLLLFLLGTYIGIYTKTKSSFTVGLILLSMVLLMNAVSSNPLVIWAFGFRLIGLGPFAVLPDLFTLGALLVLIYYVLKY